MRERELAARKPSANRVVHPDVFVQFFQRKARPFNRSVTFSRRFCGALPSSGYLAAGKLKSRPSASSRQTRRFFHPTTRGGGFRCHFSFHDVQYKPPAISGNALQQNLPRLRRAAYSALMRLLDRYLFRELLTPMAYCLGGFLVFWISYDLFTELDKLQDAKLHLLDVVEYAVAMTPAFLATVLPIALLLALLYTLTNHARHNEITAMRAAGMSLWRICAAVFHRR